MTESNNKTVVRCRAIIVHDNKLLAVKHAEQSEFYALPGGHLEWGEDIIEAMKREVMEELGVEPKIGRLLYVHNLVQPAENLLPAKQSIEFFFEVTNSVDFLDTNKLGGTHKFEIFDMSWIDKNDTKTLMPKRVQTDLNNGIILSDTVRFIFDSEYGK